MLHVPGHTQGGRLPPEEALAAELGISRPVLRQALAQLKAEGLLESRRGSGTYIRPAAAKPEALPGYGMPETLADLEDCLRFRMVIEELAAAEAARRRAPAALRELAQAVEAMERAPVTEAQNFEADMAFHLAIARATENRYIFMTLSFLMPHIRICLQMGRQLRAVPLNLASRRVAGEHRAILASIESGNAEDAAQRMHDHLLAGIERVFGKRGW
ncbi:MAG: FadR family transcriptional regulator [Rhodobacteraceae bacterium]|nr:FadR family transcriptional regulator [Paracoccaceae bacterium]